jgi:hypothetical protein
VAGVAHGAAVQALAPLRRRPDGGDGGGNAAGPVLAGDGVEHSPAVLVAAARADVVLGLAGGEAQQRVGRRVKGGARAAKLRQARLDCRLHAVAQLGLVCQQQRHNVEDGVVVLGNIDRSLASSANSQVE